MSLSPALWREIEASAVNAHTGSDTDHGRVIWAIELGKLRTIIKRSRRSLDQNSLLWALYTEALEKGGEALAGWTTNDLHEYMLGEWSGWVTTEALGRKRQKPARRSSTLTKTEFSEFVDFMVRRFAEHGVVLDLSDSNYKQGQ